MKDTLRVDLSWNKRKTVSQQELHELLQSVSDIESLKSQLSDRVEVHTVWDVIAENVLKTKTEWNVIKNELKDLKDFRNKSAHYQVITEKQKTKLIDATDQLLIKMKPKQRTTQKDYQNMLYFSKSLSKTLTEQLDVYKTIQKQLIPDIKTSALITSESMKTIKGIDLSWVAAYQKTLLDISSQLNTLKNPYLSLNSDGEKDETPDQDDNSEEDEDTDNSSKKSTK